ncbi:MAG: HEAT repeat domain-containing protein [Gemmataceae bacterium]
MFVLVLCIPIGNCGVDLMADPVPQLIRALTDDDTDIGRDAADKLFELGAKAKAAIPALVEALKLSDRRRQVIAVLRAIGPDAKEAIPALAAILKDGQEDFLGRTELGGALIKIAGRDAIPLLEEALRSKIVVSRRAAACTLGEIPSEAKTVVPILITALKDKEEKVRDSATSSLKNMGAFGVARLSTALTDKDPYLRVHAAYALVEIDAQKHGAAVVMAIVGDLKNTDTTVRQQAARVLSYAGPQAKPAASALQKALTDKDYKVRGSAAWALGNIGSAGEAAIPDLITALNDSEGQVQMWAMRSLGTFGSAAKKAVPKIIEGLSHPEAIYRQFAAEALGDIGPEAKEAISALEKLAKKDKYEEVQEAAVEAVKKIKGK